MKLILLKYLCPCLSLLSSDQLITLKSDINDSQEKQSALHLDIQNYTCFRKQIISKLLNFFPATINVFQFCMQYCITVKSCIISYITTLYALEFQVSMKND